MHNGKSRRWKRRQGKENLQEQLLISTEGKAAKRQWFLHDEDATIDLDDGSGKRLKSLQWDDHFTRPLVEEASHKWPQSDQ